MINEFIFILGQTQKLAAFELKKVLENRIVFDSFIVDKNRAIIKSEVDPEKITELINILGGTVKIGQFVGEGDWLEIIKSDLVDRPVRDVGLSFYTGNSSNAWQLKSELNNAGVKIRLVMPKHDGVLNEAEIRSNKLIGKGREYLIAGDKIYETLAVQKVGEFVERDYGKPRNNAFAGMLPPKLARMMVNLAVSQEITNSKSQITNKDQNSKIPNCLEFGACNLDFPRQVVVDPFCGSGNILLEALDLGYGVQGSDISPKAVEWTRENLDWLVSQKFQNSNDKYQTNSKLQNPKPNNLAIQQFSNVFKADATKDDFLRGLLTINDELSTVIVTEPFLGQPKKGKISHRQAEAELDKLAELYLGFLSNLSKLCHSRAGGNPLIDRVDSPEEHRGNDNKRDGNDRQNLVTLSLVFPAYETYDGGLMSLYSRIVDKISALGYIRLAGPFLYGRDYQIVKREVLLFGSKSNVKVQSSNIKSSSKSQ